MKFIAFYLPQFHEIKENNEWWGTGFTEWVNVKQGTPLFDGHYQPHVPYNNNYYDLIKDENVFGKQIELAKKYGIDGFCFYHYWFKDGKKLLEKPVERFLDDKTLDISFCLSWANENWTRRWDGKEYEVLISQDYDNEKGWFEHYEYLKKFFSDDRYLKDKFGRPIFIIYKPQEIPSIKMMLDSFNEWAMNDGFGGLCFVCQFPQKDVRIKKLFDYMIDFEPVETVMQWDLDLIKTILTPSLFLSFLKSKLYSDIGKRTYRVFDYRTFIKSSYRRKYKEKVWRGVFPGWDNTARRKLKADIYHNSTPKLFQKYLEKQISNTLKTFSDDDSYIFVNAWNEWGEGAHLEPDEKYGFSYLESVKSARSKYRI